MAVPELAKRLIDPSVLAVQTVLLPSTTSLLVSAGVTKPDPERGAPELLNLLMESAGKLAAQTLPVASMASAKGIFKPPPVYAVRVAGVPVLLNLEMELGSS